MANSEWSRALLGAPRRTVTVGTLLAAFSAPPFVFSSAQRWTLFPAHAPTFFKHRHLHLGVSRVMLHGARQGGKTTNNRVDAAVVHYLS